MYMGEDMSEKERKGRQDWIDLTRLIAMVIVMMNHVGLKVAGVNFWGGMFYVPVFFVLSGFCYKPNKEDPMAGIGKRAKRLLLPYLVTNLLLILIFLCKDILSGSYQGTLLRSLGFLYGRNQLYYSGDVFFFNETGDNVFFMTALNSPTWFLPALFLTSLMMEELCRAGEDASERKDIRIRRQRMLLVILLLILLAQIWHYMVPILLPWSVDAVPVFLVLFYVGFLCGRQGGWKYLTARPWLFLLMVLLVIAGGLVNGSANMSIGDYGVSMSLGIINAAASSMLIMYVCYLFRDHIPRLLAAAGRKTLPLLCWHYPLLTVLDTGITRLFDPKGVLLPICRGAEIPAVITVICLADELIKRCMKSRQKSR